MDLLSRRSRRAIARSLVAAASVITLWTLLPPTSTAQTVSPGPLSKAHADLEGVKSCTQCHELGRREISAGRCLACHEPLAARVRAGQGYHASREIAGAPCESCHHEHLGRDIRLVRWQPSQAAFDHARTGYRLEGAHAKVECRACHDRRRILQAEVRAWVDRHAAVKTFLGLDRRCAACHFDEHRSQLPGECSSCHTSASWKPAAGFDHERTRYPLQGAHRRVACDRCHPLQTDPAYVADGFPKARAASYARYQGVAHRECSDCHKDPHAGRMGGTCASCHVADRWSSIVPASKAGGFDHGKTRYPLTGRHRAVTCERCHPSDAAGRLVLSGFAFQSCTDCHADAHAGQISASEAGGDCARCHHVEGFVPARFTVVDHEKTRYPLTGGHIAVPCGACHPGDSTLQPAPAPPGIRSRKTDSTRLAYGSADLQNCATCHVDPHAGQFSSTEGGRPSRACADCHVGASFLELKFDHGRDTSFPLHGRHAKVACAGCHRPSAGGAGPRPALLPWLAGPSRGPRAVIGYRGIPTECAACHADVHLGQFDAAAKRDCGRCHTDEAFRPAARFDHAGSRFPLTGLHAKAKCESCHRAIEILPGRKTNLYRPLPTACEGCHADPHAGAFRIGTASCASCHATTSWMQIVFDHDRTRFPLGAPHAGLACDACHTSPASLPSMACASCHADPHGGLLGDRCERCHTGAEFHDGVDFAFHERTRLPLLGRHAAIPCAACHVDRAVADPSRLDPRCVSCHEDDYRRTESTGMSHAAWGFGRACEDCHETFRWDRATFRQHESCFPIRSGHHSTMACDECHTALPQQPTSGCNTRTASCTRCHGCGHAAVPGYECKDRKCYECHPDGGGGD
jgi:hypothetical protein